MTTISTFPKTHTFIHPETGRAVTYVEGPEQGVLYRRAIWGDRTLDVIPQLFNAVLKVGPTGTRCYVDEW